MEDDDLWIDWFLGLRGNEYFCEIDVDYIADRFNLTGLNTEVEHIQETVELITHPVDFEDPESDERRLDYAARHLYGLVHARYILTSRGLHRMMEKFNSGDFGRCPRALCRGQPLLPIGLHDQPRQSGVKLYCCKCEDVYNPRSSRHASIDGAYFGSSFPGMFFQVYTKLLPRRTNEQFTLRVFGFKLHEHSELARWQQEQRSKLYGLQQ